MDYAKSINSRKSYQKMEKIRGKKIIVVANEDDIPTEYDKEKYEYVTEQGATKKSQGIAIASMLTYIQQPVSNKLELDLLEELVIFSNLIDKYKDKCIDLSTIQNLMWWVYPTIDDLSIMKGLNLRLELLEDISKCDINGILQFVSHASKIQRRMLWDNIEANNTRDAAKNKSYRNLSEWNEIEKLFNLAYKKEKEMLASGKAFTFPNFFYERMIDVATDVEISQATKHDAKQEQKEEIKKKIPPKTDDEIEQEKKEQEKIKEKIKKEISNNTKYARRYRRLYSNWKKDLNTNEKNSNNIAMDAESFYKKIWKKRKWPKLFDDDYEAAHINQAK